MTPKNALRWLGLVAGAGLFGWVLSSTDLRAVVRLIGQLHWRFLMIFAFYAVIFGLDTLGWKYALQPAVQSRIPWNRLFRARLAGEAVNYVTPTASIGGEPVKAVLLSRRFGVPMAEGMASVVVAKTTFSVSMLLFAMFGLGVAWVIHPLPDALMRWVWAVLIGLSVALGLFVLVQFLQPFQNSAGFFRKWFPGSSVLEEKGQGWDQAIRSLYAQSPGSLFWSLGFHFLGWMAGALEVYLILRLLQIPISFSTAFIIESLWVLLRSGAFMIPGSLGASEGFLLLICSGVGISAVAGLALALLRRAREICWTGLGLLEFSRG